MAKRHRFVALPQPTCGQVGAVKYRGSVSQILITYMDPKMKCEFFKIIFVTVGHSAIYTAWANMNIHLE